MKPFGITGNIGCGKSTVAALLAEYSDVLILNCDDIAKEIVASAERKDQINDILGTDAYADGTADFRLIAKVIFEQPEKKRLLEVLIHPLVWAAVDTMAAATGDKKLCIVESAIIFETGSEEKFAAIIAATCNPHEQFRRLQQHRNMDADQIQARIMQQLPSHEKERRSQFVIQTDCSLDQLKEKVHQLYINLKQQKETET